MIRVKSQPTKWTAGRVVEGARLERGYRVTYLGFESLAVHHLKSKLVFTDIILEQNN